MYKTLGHLIKEVIKAKESRDALKLGMGIDKPLKEFKKLLHDVLPSLQLTIDAMIKQKYNKEVNQAVLLNHLQQRLALK